jgi:hypothetical protein
MTGELITLPVRLSARAARLALRGGLEVSGRALSLITYAVKAVSPDDSDTAPERTPPTDPVDVRAPAEPEPASPADDEPMHVSEEPVLVEDLAEPGAEEGAGAEVTIAEPWEGYRDLNARDVIARLSDATPAELAAVELYERAHRHRETVLAAAERALAAKSGSRAQATDQLRKEHADGG